MGGIRDSVSMQHIQQTTSLPETGPTKETGGSGIKATIPDSPRGAQAKLVSAMSSRLEDRQIGMHNLLSKEGAKAVLDRSGSSVKSTLLGVLFKISPQLVGTGERSERTSIKLADQYQKLCQSGGTAEQKLALLRELKGQLETASGRSRGQGNEALAGMIKFVDHEMAAVEGHGDLAKEILEFDMGSLNRVTPREKEPTLQEQIRGFDRTQLKHVETQEKDSVKLQADIRSFDKSQLKGIPQGPKSPTIQEQIRSFDKTTLKHVDTRAMPTDLKGLLVAAELEALWNKDANAALMVGRAIQEDPRLAPFAAACDGDPSLARMAEKLVALSKLDKGAADTLINAALKELSDGHSLDTLKPQVDQKLVGASLQKDFTVALAQSGSRMQDWSVSWNTKTAEHLANLLIDGTGHIDRGLIAEIRTQLASDGNRTGNPRGPHAQHLTAMLDKLESSATFRTAIESVKAPKVQSGNGANIVRATLGLPEGAPVGEIEARRAVLSAVLGEMRQNDVGSCFATSIAIRVQSHQPERMVADLAQMIESNVLTRPKGTGTVEVPVSGRMSTKDLQKEIQIDGTGNLTHVGGRALNAPVALSTVPGLVSGMKALGIPEDKIAARLQDAATKVGSPTSAEALLKHIAMEESGVSSDMLTARADVQRLGGEVRTLTAELAKLDSELRTLEKNKAPESQIQAKKGEITTKENQLNARIDEYSQRHDDMLSRVSVGPSRDPESLARFDQKMSLASNAFLAQMDNRLLRSWEYTLSGFAEQGLAVQNKRLGIGSLFGSLTTTGGRTLPGLDAKLEQLFPGSDPATVKLRDDFKAKLQELLTTRLQVQYDASRGVGGVSADGRSDRGTFALYDNTGVKDPALWHKADSPDAFGRMLSGMILDAGHDFMANPKFAQALDELAHHAFSPELQELAVRQFGQQYNQTYGDPLPSIDTIAKTPWSMSMGDDSSNVQANYFNSGVDKLASLQNTTPNNARELLSWIIGNLQTMRPEIEGNVDGAPRTYSIPLSNAPHAFLLMPGHADLRSAWNSGVNTDTWINNQLSTPGQTLSTTAINDTDFNKILDKLPTDLKGTITTCKGNLTTAGEPLTPQKLYAQLVSSLPVGTTEAEKTDRTTKLKQLNAAMANVLNAPTVAFADSNWGGGSEHTQFTATYNLGTGQIEMWQRGTPDGNRWPLDQHEWVNCRWGMTTNPKDYGEA